MVILYEAERHIIEAWKVLYDYVPESTTKDKMNAAVNALEEFHYPEVHYDDSGAN